MTKDVELHDPDSVLDIANDWNASASPDGPYLEAGETIPAPHATNSTWRSEPDDSADPGGLVLSNPTVTGSGTVTNVTRTGGIKGRLYRIVNKIITDAGRTEERTRTILIGSR